MGFAQHREPTARRAVFRAQILLAVAVVAVTANSIARPDQQSRQALELRVKARFLYTFGKYVDWPPDTFGSATNAVVIGILGKDPFGGILDETVAGKAINGHRVNIRRFQRVEDIETCHVLFISASEKEQLPNIRSPLAGRKILTVSDLDGFFQTDGQIHFVMQDNRVRFDINLEAIRRAGLKLDANLIREARRVIPPTGKTETQ
jgi:hypothetical protein